LGVSFAYWTDPIFDPTTPSPTDTKYNMLTADGLNAPAPWVPYTRAGCNFGAVATANTVLENIATDIPTVFGPGSPQAAEVSSDPTCVRPWSGRLCRSSRRQQRRIREVVRSPSDRRHQHGQHALRIHFRRGRSLRRRLTEPAGLRRRHYALHVQHHRRNQHEPRRAAGHSAGYHNTVQGALGLRPHILHN